MIRHCNREFTNDLGFLLARILGQPCRSGHGPGFLSAILEPYISTISSRITGELFTSADTGVTIDYPD